MSLSEFQSKIAKLLAKNRSPESHLAGGAALHFEPNSIRYSNDLDYFHDSDVAVAKAFEADEKSLKESGYEIKIEMRVPGYLRGVVSKEKQMTKIEWAYDSNWRFMPVIEHNDFGYLLHPVDLWVNKLLALIGREEARDFLDILDIHAKHLSLGALCWALPGKDPGFNPQSLLELIKRRGHFRTEDFERLNLNIEVDLQDLKTQWQKALQEAASFIDTRPVEELGGLYFHLNKKTFYSPTPQDQPKKDYQIHFGKPGGILPQLSSV